MTKKQMKKLAREIYQCELIHSSETATKEEKLRAENRLIQITSQIMEDGLDTMLEIDTMVQGLVNRNFQIKGDTTNNGYET